MICYHCLASRRGTQYCDQPLCLSVCLSVRSHISKPLVETSHEICCRCYLWPWLGPPLTVAQYVMLCTSGFVDDIMFSHNGDNGAKSNTTLCFVEFASWRHQGRILMSTFALFSKKVRLLAGSNTNGSIATKIYGDFRRISQTVAPRAP